MSAIRNIDTAMAVTSVTFSDFRMEVKLAGGESFSVYLGSFPRLSHATAAQRDNWMLTDNGRGIGWPELGQDLSVSEMYRHSERLNGRMAMGA